MIATLTSAAAEEPTRQESWLVSDDRGDFNERCHAYLHMQIARQFMVWIPGQSTKSNKRFIDLRRPDLIATEAAYILSVLPSRLHRRFFKKDLPASAMAVYLLPRPILALQAGSSPAFDGPPETCAYFAKIPSVPGVSTLPI